MIEKIISHPIHLRRLINIRGKIYSTVGRLDVEYLPSKEPIEYAEAVKKEFKPFKTGKVWTKDEFGCCWFRFKGVIPEKAKGEKTVAIVKLAAEGEVYVGGEAKQGLTQILATMDAGSSLMGKQVYPLAEVAEGGEAVEFLVDAGHNGYCGAFFYDPILLRADIAVVNEDIFAFYYDYNCLLLALCTKGKNQFLTDEKYEFFSSKLDDSYALFRKNKLIEARKILEDILAEKQTGGVEYYAVGHGHLDLAWRWPIRESHRKAIRTLSNAISNFDKYPDYIFGASQAQMFDWVKNDDPVLYEKVKKAVKEKRIELQGGMWTECDCNMSGGESIIRQFLYGEKFFQSEFGVSSDVVWLPDVFGFTSTLPQIFAGVGKKYFMTIKLNWNEHNEFPYQTFDWVAPDGSKVLAHFSPEKTYCCSASPLAFVKADANNKHKEVGAALVIFGVSDGGGGPGEGHLEMLKRSGFDGMPKTRPASSEEFFERIADKPRAEYKGELYLEKHQGTLTSQSLNKYYNRICERKLHLLEWLEVVSSYPFADKEELWKIVLLNQFHDVLPGSGITRVHKESVDAYREVERRLDEEIENRIKKLSSGERLTAINPSPFPSNGIVEVNGECYSYECDSYSSAPLSKCSPEFEAKENTIRNEFVSVRQYFDRAEITDGRTGLKSVYRLTLWKDPKTHFDAWDISEKYLDKKPVILKSTSIKCGNTASKAYIESTYSFGNSKAVQTVFLQNDGAVRVSLKVDWRESHKMLRAECTPSYFTDKAEFDVQFGSCLRSTKNETTIEKAQYEVCGHKYALVGDEDGGFTAIITEGKYGYRVKDGVMSLNLLKSPKFPDKECDMGEHEINYAFLSSTRREDVVRFAYNYNYPVLITQEKVDIKNELILPENAVLETVKPAESGAGVIVRVYERYGKTSTLNFPVAAETDMLERPKPTVDLNLTPYKIKTYLIEKV